MVIDNGNFMIMVNYIDNRTVLVQDCTLSANECINTL